MRRLTRPRSEPGDDGARVDRRAAPMKAVILAAGYGRPMQPLSSSVHKALLPVAGTTILKRAIDALSGRVSELTIVTGYLG